MGNRIIKESICTSDNVDQLTAFQETFFYRLIVNCDDHGRMDARPKILSSRLFPLKNIREDQVLDALRALTSAELVILYTVGGKPFLQMKTWELHQQIRAMKEKYPGPDRADPISDDISCNQMISDDIRRNQMMSSRARAQNPIQSESNPNPNPTRACARETQTDPGFDAFWAGYPNRVAKTDALKAWKKLKPDEALTESIMAGLGRWKESDEWQREDGRFIPHPATWLNGRRWEDEVRKAKPKTAVTAQQYEQRDYTGVDAQLVAEQMRRVAQMRAISGE